MKMLRTNGGIARATAALRTLKHMPARWLHPLRRNAQLKRIHRAGLPKAVLFVCHGNICRSPYAEHAFVRLLPTPLKEYMEVCSAGFTGAGRPTPANGLTAAGRRGIDLNGHRSRLLTTELVQKADLIVVAEARQRRELCVWFGARPKQVVVLGDLDPEPIETRTVRDPIFQEREVFDATYARIDRCVAELVGAITGGETAPVRDPRPLTAPSERARPEAAAT